MTRKFQVKRGLDSKVPLLDVAEFGLAIDTNKIYMGGQSGNISIPSKEDIDGINDQLDITAKKIDIKQLLKASSMTDIETISNFDVADKSTFINAIKNNNATVTAWGDSITQGGNPLDPESSYVEIYKAQLKIDFPNCNFDFKNLGIGGVSILEAMDDNYIPTSFADTTQVVDGVTNWKTYVKNTAPDLLIVAFGMNTQQTISDMIYTTENMYTNFIKTWGKIPTVIFITTYLVRELLNNSYGLIWESARATRAWSKSRNLITFDVNNVYTKLLKEADNKNQIETGYLQDVLNTTIQTVNEGVISYNGNDLSGIHVDNMLDFTISATVNYKSTDAIYKVMGRQAIIIAISVTGDIKITYDGIGVGDFITSAFTLNTDYNISIGLLGSIITIKVNNIIVTTFELFLTFVSGPTSMGSQIGQLDVSNILILQFSDNNTYPVLTEDDMLGDYIDGDYGTKYPTGGNGLNHPTWLATQILYKPFILDFDNKIKSEIANTIDNSKMMMPLLIKSTDWVVSNPSFGLVATSGLNIYVCLEPTNQYDMLKPMYLQNLVNYDTYKMVPINEHDMTSLASNEIGIATDVDVTKNLVFITAATIPTFDSLLYFIH